MQLFEEDKAGMTYKLRQAIYQLALDVIEKKAEVDFNELEIECPKEENYGDYSTNLALKLAKRLKIEPVKLAEIIKEKLDNYIKEHQITSKKTDSFCLSDIIDRIEVVKPGFINFWLTRKYLVTQLVRVLETVKIVSTIYLQDKKIAVEYTDPNPFKEFHLGHMYSNFIGESLSRLFETCGASVWRGDFYGDVGMHVAKSLYGLLAKLKTQNSLRLRSGQAKLKTLLGKDYINELTRYIQELETLPISQRQKLLGEGYALGVRSFEEDKKAQEDIKELNTLIYVAAQEVLKKEKKWEPIVDYRQFIKGKENKLEEVQLIYEAGLRWSLAYFETIYKKLGTKFDGYYPESWVGEYGMRLVNKGLKMGALEESDGAIVFRGEEEGLHTRVFVNKLGLPTYEAKDLGLALAKYQDFPYDLSLNVFGKEIDEYYKVVKAAMMKIEPELGKKAFHIAHGMVKLPEGKMSSRTGNVITFEWIVAEAKRHAEEMMKDVDLSETEKERVAETVGLGAVRYALLKSSLGGDVVFDFKKSVSLEGDSGPYLQYAYARCKSVLRKGMHQTVRPKGMHQTVRSKGMHQTVRSKGMYQTVRPKAQNTFNTFADKSLSLLKLLKSIEEINPEELALLRSFVHFEENVWTAAKTLSPNIVCAYLFDLAQKFNLFYQKHQILRIKNQELRIKKTGQTADDKQQLTENKDQQIQLTTEFRLALTETTAKILKRGLNLLGIEVVERM